MFKMFKEFENTDNNYIVLVFRSEWSPSALRTSFFFVVVLISHSSLPVYLCLRVYVFFYVFLHCHSH